MRRLLLILISARAFASGFVEDEDFSPDYTVESSDDFIGGKLGIVSEALWPRWRAVAFRVLSGVPLEPRTRLALANNPPDEKAGSPVDVWLKTRKQFPSLQTPPNLPNVEYGYMYENCYADAFATAVATLKARAQKFGAQSKEVKEWLTAQDLVFANCDSATPTIPPPQIAPGVDGSLQKDRDYQVAAAWFYARKFPDARVAFERVAADSASPWAGWGRFVTARAMIRQATSENTDLYLLDQSEKKLQAVLKDKQAAPLHDSAKRLIRFIAFRTRPEQQILELGDLLAKGNGDDFGLILTDFAWLADKQPTPLTSIQGFEKSELTEWTLAWQLPESERAALAVQRYRQKKSVPWLVLALAAVSPDHPQAKALLEDARQVKPGLPGYATATFHRARLLLGQKRLPAARGLLDEALQQKDLPREAHNRFAEMRYNAARTLDEAIAFMSRQPKSGDPVLAPEASNVFLQFLPIAESAQAAADPRLPKLTRLQLLRAAFLRAALLEERDLAKIIAPRLVELDADAKKLVDEWSAAAGAPERQNAIVHAGLRSSWLLYLIGTTGHCGSNSPALAEKKPPPGFIEAPLQARARDESQRLDALVGEPSTFRANHMADWAPKHKTDRRVPEDLSLAVVGTKHSCDGARATAASKRAWKVLHKLFPNDDFTRDTKYWYP